MGDSEREYEKEDCASCDLGIWACSNVITQKIGREEGNC